MEHLVKYSTVDIVNLPQTAEDYKNEALLMQVKNKDCVAIELKNNILARKITHATSQNIRGLHSRY